MPLDKHERSCRCDSCLAFFWAVRQTKPDGAPLFTDAELEELALMRAEGHEDAS